MHRFDRDDHREEFSRAVAALVTNDIDDEKERIKAVDRLIESYIAQTGERPDHQELDELAGWIIWGPDGITPRKQKQIKLIESEVRRNG